MPYIRGTLKTYHKMHQEHLTLMLVQIYFSTYKEALEETMLTVVLNKMAILEAATLRSITEAVVCKCISLLYVLSVQ